MNAYAKKKKATNLIDVWLGPCNVVDHRLDDVWDLCENVHLLYKTCGLVRRADIDYQSGVDLAWGIGNERWACPAEGELRGSIVAGIGVL